MFSTLCKRKIVFRPSVKVFPHITDGFSILSHETAKKVLESTDIGETRFWHREFRSLVIKINHMKELLKLDRKLEIVLFRSGIDPYAAFESV